MEPTVEVLDPVLEAFPIFLPRHIVHTGGCLRVECPVAREQERFSYMVK